jgi:WD40 repeat protein
VFYELVAGRRPYTADTPAAILLKHVNDPLPSPRQFVRELPYQVEQVLNRALAKNLDDRFQTMGEFAERLEQLSVSPRAGGTRTVAAAAGGPTVLVQPTGTNLRAPATPPPPRPPTGSYPNTGTNAAARPQTGPYPNTGGTRPPTGSYPNTGAYPDTGAYKAPPVTPTQPRNSKLVWLLAGLAGLVILCLIGGVAGGAYLYQQYTLSTTGPLPTKAGVATVSSEVSNTPPAPVSAATETPPPPSAVTETPAGPVPTTPVPILPIATGVGQTGRLSSVAFSPDGQWLVSASDDQTIRVWGWDGTTAAYRLDLRGHTDGVLGLAFNSDGSKLASAGRDGTVRLWTAQTATLLQTLEGHTAPVRSVAFSPDGKYLASGSEDGTVRLWNAGTGAFIRALHDSAAAPEEQVWAVAFSPDAQTLVAAGTSTRLWNVEGPADKPRQWLSSVKANGIAFQPDGQAFATAGSSVQIWDTASGQIRGSLGDSQTTEWSVAFSPDGQRVAAGSQDGVARVWSTTGELQLAFSGHLADVNGVTFSPDGRFLASASTDQVVRVWQIQANPVPTFTAWPPSATPTKVVVPPTRVIPTTAVPVVVVPTTPVPVIPTTAVPVIPTTPAPLPVITIPIIRLTAIIRLPTFTPTPRPIIILPKLTVPVIVLPNEPLTPSP